MDPDMRAALIQRVPKAVKRTSCVPVFMPQNSIVKPPTTTTVKHQKAVKHTMPRSLFDNRGGVHEQSVNYSMNFNGLSKYNKLNKN